MTSGFGQLNSGVKSGSYTSSMTLFLPMRLVPVGGLVFFATFSTSSSSFLAALVVVVALLFVMALADCSFLLVATFLVLALVSIGFGFSLMALALYCLFFVGGLLACVPTFPCFATFPDNFQDVSDSLSLSKAKLSQSVGIRTLFRFFEFDEVGGCNSSSLSRNKV